MLTRKKGSESLLLGRPEVVQREGKKSCEISGSKVTLSQPPPDPCLPMAGESELSLLAKVRETDSLGQVTSEEAISNLALNFLSQISVDSKGATEYFYFSFALI